MANVRLSVLAHKGGVGKTTTIVTLADLLTLAGKRVLLVDLDVQGNVADALGMQADNGLFDFMVADAGMDAVRATRRGFDVIFSGPKTVRVKRDLITMPSYERPELRLRRALNAIADAYDVVLLDTAPSVDVLQVAAVATATHVMVPLSLDQYAVKGAVQVIKLLGTLKRNRVFEGRLLGLIPTRWERVTTESRLQLEAMHAFGKKSKVPCYPPVPEDVRVKEAARAGQTLPEYDRDMRALRGVRMRSGKRVGGYVRIAMVLEEAL